MGNPIVGYDGSVASGANSADFIGSWDFESKWEVKKRGPYIGDSGTLYKVVSSRDGSGSLKGELRAGSSTFRAALVAAEAAGSDIALTLIATSGVKVSGSAFKITSLKIEAKADEGIDINFDFEANGAYTIDDEPYT
jgi:hypothetical protein